MGRRNRSSRCGSFDLVTAPGSATINFVRRVTARDGDDLVAKGKAKLEYCEELEVYYYQLTGAETRITPSRDDMARFSCTVLDRLEVEAAIGMHGESRTAGLSNLQRKMLEMLNRETHDFIERAGIKLDTFKPRHSQPLAL